MLLHGGAQSSAAGLLLHVVMLLDAAGGISRCCVSAVVN
jgi:hypothetical protein